MGNQFASTASSLYNLKIFYQGPIVDQFNEETPIYRGAEKAKFAWSGLQVNRPLRTRRNQGIGATTDGGTLPSIGQQQGVQAVIPAAYNYLRFGVTGPMIKASANDKGSFVRQAAFELQKGYEDLQSDCNRQCSWNGDGTLAVVNTGAFASQSLVVAGRTSTEAALKFLDVTEECDIWDATFANLLASSVQITAISSGTAISATATLVLDTAVTVPSGAKVVRAGSYQNEVKGLLYQLDGLTTTVFGINRSTYPSTQGNVVDYSGNQLNLDGIQQAWNLGASRGGAKFSALYSDFDSQRYYQKLLVADKRFVNTVEGDGGFSNKDKVYLEYNGIPWVADKDCPTKIFLLPEDHIEKHVLCEMEFADETGSMYIAQTSADSFEVRVRHFFNLFNAQASASAVITGYVSP